MRTSRELLALYKADKCPNCEAGDLKHRIDQDMTYCHLCGFYLTGREQRVTTLEKLPDFIRQRGKEISEQGIQ